MKLIKAKFLILTLALQMLMLSCQSLKTAVFDQYSYQQAISLKVESNNLLENATTSYDDYDIEVDELLLDLQKMMEYEKNKPNNEVSYAMWQVMADEDKNLLAGFIKRWDEEEKLSETFSREARQQIMEAFDLIIKYEAQKNKTNETNILNFLSTN